MAFMEPEITEKQYWYQVDGHMGISNYPCDYFSRNEAKEAYGKDKVWNVKKLKAYGVRLSASGYLDCTEWNIYSNKREATRAAKELTVTDY